MKILVEDSSWNNVGDGWYQTSLYGLLRKLYPEHQVLLGEGPIRRSFGIHKEQFLLNSLNVMEYETADIHVFSGPMMPVIIRDYGTTIRNILSRGEQYVLISASGTGLSSSRVLEIGEFLKKYPPLFLSTRDEESYHNFSPYVKNAYNGICTAFLVDKTLTIEKFILEKPFFISSFYTELEPTFYVPEGQTACIENIDVQHHSKMWGLPYGISRHLNYMRPQQKEVGGYLIVRTIQGLNPKFNHINFAMPNSFVSFNPLRYLEVTKSSEFTISDRVHACAIALACGKPARFLFKTPRAGIFDRMGFDYKSNGGIMYPNMIKVEEEMELLSNEIKKYI